jgi:hypothetical protein
MKKEGDHRFRILGFGFILFGILWCSLNKLSCTSICKDCGLLDIKPCYFLFLFVGIIFIVNGTSIILMWGLRDKSKKTKK